MSGARQTGKTVWFGALRFGFRLVPMSEATRDRLRQWFLDRFSHLVPPGPRGQTAPAIERRPRVRSDQPAIGYVPYRQEPLPSPLPATLVAFYLPQFHPIAENDEWWGKGFTEWRNVARALPQFEGHAQPRLPGDLGFYDLRNPHVLRDQAELAQAYGIGAFCMYYYWFGGKTLLDLPHKQWLNDKSIPLPICLCWANENWTRTWDGRAEDVLIAQQHSPEDDLAYIAHVAQYLRDPRYLRIEGKPLLLVYRPGKLPDPQATAGRWRAWCRENGIGELCIGYVQSFERPDPRAIGFDVAVEFPPNLSTAANITQRQTLLNPDYRGEVLDWRDVARDYSQRTLPGYRLFPGVNCGWDNEPRRPGRGRTYLHASPRAFGQWLLNTIHHRLANVPPASRMVFINAWNEWAEGAVLEPSARLGHAFLGHARLALSRSAEASNAARQGKRAAVVVHVWHIDLMDEMLDALAPLSNFLDFVFTTTPDRAPALCELMQRRNISAEVHTFENRGRDVLPFLHVANLLLDRGQDIVLKLHTKQSPHLADGASWRRQLVLDLTSPAAVSSIIGRFRSDECIGLVVPDGHILSLDGFQGANAAGLQHLVKLLGLALPEREDAWFPAGSMFWVRLSALRPLLDAHLAATDFETENGQVDGTLAHATERLIAEIVKAAGYTCVDTSLRPLATPAYRYPFA